MQVLYSRPFASQFESDSYFLPIFFDNYRQALGALFGRVGHFVFLSNKREHAIHSLLKEFDIHVLGAAGEEEVYLYPVAVLNPLGDLFCLKFEIVLAGTDFDLYRLHFDDMGLRFGLLCLFVGIVYELAVIADLCDRRNGIRRYLNEIKSGFLCELLRFRKGNDAEVFAFRSYDAKLCRADLLVYSYVYTQLFSW